MNNGPLDNVITKCVGIRLSTTSRWNNRWLAWAFPCTENTTIYSRDRTVRFTLVIEQYLNHHSVEDIAVSGGHLDRLNSGWDSAELVWKHRISLPKSNHLSLVEWGIIILVQQSTLICVHFAVSLGEQQMIFNKAVGDKMAPRNTNHVSHWWSRNPLLMLAARIPSF